MPPQGGFFDGTDPNAKKYDTVFCRISERFYIDGRRNLQIIKYMGVFTLIFHKFPLSSIFFPQNWYRL